MSSSPPSDDIVSRLSRFVSLVIFAGLAFAFNAYVAQHPTIPVSRTAPVFATQRLPASSQGVWLTFHEQSQQARVALSTVSRTAAGQEVCVYVVTRGKFPLRFDAHNAWLVSADRRQFTASSVSAPAAGMPFTRLTYTVPSETDSFSLIWMARVDASSGWEVSLRPHEERPAAQGGLLAADFLERPTAHEVSAASAAPALSVLQDILHQDQPQCQWYKQVIGARSRLIATLDGSCDSLTIAASEDGARAFAVGSQHISINLHDGVTQVVAPPAGNVDLRAFAFDSNNTPLALVSQEERKHAGSMSIDDLVHFQLFRRNAAGAWDFVAAQTTRRSDCGLFWGHTSALGKELNCHLLHASANHASCFPATLLRDDCTTSAWEALSGDIVAKLPSDPDGLGWVQINSAGATFIASLVNGTSSIDPRLDGPLYSLQDGDMAPVDGFNEQHAALTLQVRGAYAVLGARPYGAAPHFAVYDVRTGRPLQTFGAPVAAVQFWP